MESAKERDSSKSNENREIIDPKEHEDTDESSETSESELKLPDWIIPDTGGEGKGNLQYIEGWALHRKFKDRYSSVLEIVIGSLAFMSILIPVVFTESRKLPIGILGIFLTILLAYTVMMNRATMPFCIYSGGVTKSRVDMSSGVDRKESFVSWDEIESISIGSWQDGEQRGIEYLRFQFNKGGIMNQSILTSMDRNRIIAVVRKIAPESLVKDME